MLVDTLRILLTKTKDGAGDSLGAAMPRDAAWDHLFSLMVH